MEKTESFIELVEQLMNDYAYLLILVGTVLFAIGLLYFFMKNKPTPGKITDIYDVSGHRQEKKSRWLIKVIVMIGAILIVIFLAWYLY